MANILSIETSSQACSVALSRDFTVVWHDATPDGPHHAAVLGGYVAQALEYARAEGLAIDAVAVSRGPGSYTGLRIGVSEAKGLCVGLGVPLISVSTLEAMCCQVLFADEEMPDDALLCPMMDARRMEVYMGLYDRSLRPVVPVEARVIDRCPFADDMLAEHPVYFFGDGAEKCAALLRHPHARLVSDVRPMATDMLALAVKAFHAKHFEDVAYFVPFYLKDFIATKPKDLLAAVRENASGKSHTSKT